MELLEIGWAGAGHPLWSGTESCGGCWHCRKAAATAWECKWQVAVLVSLSSQIIPLQSQHGHQ